MPHRPASRDDDRVAAEMFGMLAANMRLGVPANLVAAPIFYAALSIQGPVPGFVAWLLVLLLLVLLYSAWVRPWQRRALAAGRLSLVARLGGLQPGFRLAVGIGHDALVQQSHVVAWVAHQAVDARPAMINKPLSMHFHDAWWVQATGDNPAWPCVGH